MRQFIRTMFASIEGICFVARLWAIVKLREEDRISDSELMMALEVRHDINDKGEVIEVPAKITLQRQVKFTFMLLDRVHKIEKRLDTSAPWWNSLQKTIAIRDRLTHPRLPKDLDITVDEVLTAMDADLGFAEFIHGYSSLANATEKLTQKPSE